MIAVLLVVWAVSGIQAGQPDAQFLKQHCYDCHSGEVTEAGLDLSELTFDLSSPAIMDKWVRLHDRIAAGEMPPADYAVLSSDQSQPFLQTTAHWIEQTQSKQYAELGRVRARRLTNLQLERSLHDLLGIDLPLAAEFPAEPKVNGYNTVADGQPMSHFQMEQHLQVVDLALEEAFRRALARRDNRDTIELSPKDFCRQNPKRRCREPELLNGDGVVWSAGVTFYGRVPATRARESGWYRYTITAKALNKPDDYGVWCSVRRGQCVSSAPLFGWVGSFEAMQQPQTWTFTTWMPRGEMLEIRPADNTLKRGRFPGGQVGTGEGEPQNIAGVAIESITMQRVHQGPDDQEIRTLLFGSLDVKTQRDWEKSTVVVHDEKADLEELLKHFAELAFRRPVSSQDVEPYYNFALTRLADSGSFVAALRAGYRAILCSPRFLYFQEQPGRLDDHAIASRLSYFLWNRMPDAELRSLATDRKLSDETVLRTQIERMLSDPRGQEFLADFAAQWLDLSEIDFTEPDRRLYPKFDIVVQQSMLDETHQFLQHLLANDLSVSKLIDSDFTFLNSRLARYYSEPEISGDAIRQVVLDDQSPRGGLLGQGAILKVTANGTTTSPVIRGVWISERILGQEIPAPPTAVPAIEPDIRGAKSIRDQLAKHKSIDSCAACHKHIDPPGFALENFDPAGNWRDHYGSPRSKKKGPVIDAGYEFADGRQFADLSEFRVRVLEQPEKLAHNVAHHLLVYGTGAPIGFADREFVEQVVVKSADKNYGLRTLLTEVICSPIFLHK